MSIKLAALGCDKQFYMAAADAIIRHGCRAVFLQGDTPYVNTPSQSWQGSAIPDLDLDADGDSAANFDVHYDEFLSNPGYQKLIERNIPVYVQPDDHEWMGNNWDHTVAAADDGATPLSSGTASTLQEVTDHWATGIDRWRDRYQAASGAATAVKPRRNPTNADAEAGTDVPPQVSGGGVTYSASDYGPNYFRLGVTANGLIMPQPASYTGTVAQIYVTDCISHRHDWDTADATAGKEHIGSVQKTWLETHMLAFHAANASGLHIWIDSKNWIGASGQDNWERFAEERQAIYDDIISEVTGVIHISNDLHRHFAVYDSSEPLLDVCAGPINQDMVGGPPATHRLYVSSYDNGNSWHPGYCLITIYPGERVKAEIRHAGGDQVMWSGSVPATSNVRLGA